MKQIEQICIPGFVCSLNRFYLGSEVNLALGARDHSAEDGSAGMELHSSIRFSNWPHAVSTLRASNRTIFIPNKNDYMTVLFPN
eukprot:5729797-Amphidinium_carterae.1